MPKKRRRTYTTVDVIPPACTKCGSTDRDPYHQIRTLEVSGVTANGFSYTRIVFKRTRCKGCGQCRVDRHFEHPTKVSPHSGH